MEWLVKLAKAEVGMRYRLIKASANPSGSSIVTISSQNCPMLSQDCWAFIPCLSVPQCRLHWEGHELGPNSWGRFWGHWQVEAAGQKVLWRAVPLMSTIWNILCLSFLYLQNEHDNGEYLVALLWKLNELLCANWLEQCLVHSKFLSISYLTRSSVFLLFIIRS